MSRTEITDKGGTQLKSEWFGFKYRVNPESSKLLQEAVFKDGGGWGYDCEGKVAHTYKPFLIVRGKEITFSDDEHYFETCVFLPEKQPPQPTKVEPVKVEPQAKKDFVVGKWYKCLVNTFGFLEGKYYKLGKVQGNLRFDGTSSYVSRGCFDINSESDYDPNIENPYDKFVSDLKDAFPPFEKEYKHTAYVKFKGYSGQYGSKEYCYKCDDLVFNTSRLGEYVYASVDVNGEIKTVQIQRITKDYLDPKATKCIIGIVEGGKEFVVVCTGNFFDKLQDHLAINQTGNNATTNVGDVNMSQVTRKVLNFKLIDADSALPVEFSLVHDFGDVVVEDDVETVKQQLLGDNDLKEILNKHNAKRIQHVNLEIQQKTGNTVKLLPLAKVKELTWSVK